MTMPAHKIQREQNKFAETSQGETAVRTLPEINANYVLFDSSDNNPDYIGLNDNSDAATSDEDWIIYKFVYDGSNNITSIRKKLGAWDDRVALFA